MTKINKECTDKVVNVLSYVLNRHCQRNDQKINKNTTITRFHALEAPLITIKFYLNRIARYSNCSKECFVLALIYIDRLMQKNRTFLVNSLNVHRLTIMAVMLGAKFYDDRYFNNAYFAKVGGVSLKEINVLEIEFLFMINFNLFVKPTLFNSYSKQLYGLSWPRKVNHIIKKEITPPLESEQQSQDTCQKVQEIVEEAKLTQRSIFRSSLISSCNNKDVSLKPSSSSVTKRIGDSCPASSRFLPTIGWINLKLH